MTRFDFRFGRSHRLAAVPFGVTPRSAWIEVGDDDLRVSFGPWSLETPLANLGGCEVTGPFSFVKTAGPAHLSFSDRGVTFATNGDRGLCVRFREPVAGIDPWGLIRHPGMTVTVARIDELQHALGC